MYTAINSEVIATTLKKLADLKARLRVPELQLPKSQGQLLVQKAELSNFL